MIKSIIKEVIITIICAIAIFLVVSVIFYENSSSNKVVPTKVAFEIPENIQAELDEIAQIKQLDKLNVTYTIDDEDLEYYEQSQSYNPKKADPFSEYVESADPSSNNQNNIVSNLQKQGYNIVNNNNIDNTFYESKSTK